MKAWNPCNSLLLVCLCFGLSTVRVPHLSQGTLPNWEKAIPPFGRTPWGGIKRMYVIFPAEEVVELTLRGSVFQQHFQHQPQQLQDGSHAISLSHRELGEQRNLQNYHPSRPGGTSWRHFRSAPLYSLKSMWRSSCITLSPQIWLT
jgi:hypothetical protein